MLNSAALLSIYLPSGVKTHYRLFIVLAICCLPGVLFAQSASGYVYDLETRKPIEDAVVRSGKQITRTTQNGLYTFIGLQYGDTVTVSHLSYRTYSFSFHSSLLETVFLEKHIRELSSVVIVDNPTGGDIDSILFRREFASAFRYQKTTLKDLYVPKELYHNPLEPTRPATFNSILSINLLAIPAFLKRNKASKTILQQRLLKDEQDTYLNKALFRKKVEQLTLLSGEPLENFLAEYTLPVYVLREMNDYDLIDYIKRSYRTFTVKSR